MQPLNFGLWIQSPRPWHLTSVSYSSSFLLPTALWGCKGWALLPFLMEEASETSYLSSLCPVTYNKTQWSDTKAWRGATELLVVYKGGIKPMSMQKSVQQCSSCQSMWIIQEFYKWLECMVFSEKYCFKPLEDTEETGLDLVNLKKKIRKTLKCIK